MAIVLLFLSLLQGRYYWPETVRALAHGLVGHTHVTTTGAVIKVRHELDGDTHIWIRAGLDSLVLECIPKLPCGVVRVGQIVSPKGIYRFDYEHRWYEIHPVEEGL